MKVCSVDDTGAKGLFYRMLSKSQCVGTFKLMFDNRIIMLNQTVKCQGISEMLEQYVGFSHIGGNASNGTNGC